MKTKFLGLLSMRLACSESYSDSSSVSWNAHACSFDVLFYCMYIDCSQATSAQLQ